MVNRRGKLSRKTWWVFIINCTRLPFDCSLYILQPFWRWKRLRYLPMYSCEGNDLFFFYFHWNIILLEVNRTWEYFVFVVSSLPEAISHFKLRSEKTFNADFHIHISKREYMKTIYIQPIFDVFTTGFYWNTGLHVDLESGQWKLLSVNVLFYALYLFRVCLIRVSDNLLSFLRSM